LTGLLKFKDSKSKRSSSNNGKKEKRPESTCFTKSMTIESAKLTSIRLGLSNSSR